MTLSGTGAIVGMQTLGGEMSATTPEWVQVDRGILRMKGRIDPARADRLMAERRGATAERLAARTTADKQADQSMKSKIA